MTTHKEEQEAILRNLIIDPTGRHYKKMKNAIWLFLYFLISAEREGRPLIRKIETICSDTGITRNTISRWLRILRKGRYISTENTGRFLHIELKNWGFVLEIYKNTHQKSHMSNSRSIKSETSESSFMSQGLANSSKKLQKASRPIDISIDNNILNIDIDKKEYPESIKGFKPRNKQELLALDLAKALNDLQALPLYLSYSKKYPDHLLRKVVGEVLEIPQQKIKKTRGALFNYLIQKYAKRDSKNLSN